MVNDLTWLALKAWFKKACAWCKKYWQILLGISIPLVLMVVFRKKIDLSEVLDRAREDHEKEVDAITSSYEKEIEEREASQKRYFDTIKKIEERYKENQQELESKKKKEVEKILKESAGDPEENPGVQIKLEHGVLSDDVILDGE